MPAKWWQVWRTRARPTASETRVVVYTRANCPLCDKAAAFLEKEQSKLHFTLEYVDIAGDAELTKTHGSWIPVVEVDGRVRFRGSIPPVLWNRLMRER